MGDLFHLDHKFRSKAIVDIIKNVGLSMTERRSGKASVSPRNSAIMRRATGLLVIAAFVPAMAHTQPRWTFCIASSKSGTDVWITDVFAAERSRVELESAFKAILERSGVAGADTQCPQPREDKTEAINAQFEAEEFNRRLGATLHSVSAGELPPRR